MSYEKMLTTARYLFFFSKLILRKCLKNDTHVIDILFSLFLSLTKEFRFLFLRLGLRLYQSWKQLIQELGLLTRKISLDKQFAAVHFDPWNSCEQDTTTIG